MAKQFLRWVGSKRQLTGPIVSALGADDRGIYREPFLGSGAVFFALKPSEAVLSDVNADLIAAYVALREFPELLIQALQTHAVMHNADPDYWYKGVRSQPGIQGAQDDWLASDILTKGARMIYLNKAGFNGLWRVNLKGEMNCPIGNDGNGSRLISFDVDNLRECSKALQCATIVNCDYSTALKGAGHPDRVYCDPPYVPIVTQKTNFNAYSKSFTTEDQLELIRLLSKASDNGATAILSNASTTESAGMYKDKQTVELTVKRIVAAKAEDRKIVRELLVTF